MTNIAVVEESASSQGDGSVVVGHKTAAGGTWAVGARLISRVIDLGTVLVLAHILRPKDFGLVAIAMTVIYIVESALDLPVSQALVRLPQIKSSHYDTAFTLSLLRGVALSLIVCSTSWPFAHFYTDTRLIPLVCILSLAPAARGLVSPRMTDYVKNLDFSREFAIEFVGKIAACSCGVGVAVFTKSYWAIAVGTVVAPVVGTITSYIIAPYRPRLTLAEMPSFSGFLGWFTAAQVVTAVNWHADRLLLGKLTSRAELGLFTTSNDVANIPILTFFGPILRPLLSAFAMLKEDSLRLAKSYQKSACGMVTLGLPILVGESLIAEPAVRLMFGEKWIGAAPLLRWLALSLIPALFAIPFGPLVMSFDRTQIFLKRNLFEICIKLPLVIVGALKYGFLGVICARFISETAAAFFCMRIVRQLIGLSIYEQLIDNWRSVCSALAMAAVVSICMPHLVVTGTNFQFAAGTILTILIGAATYCGVLLGLWRSAGSPSGVEALVVTRFFSLIKRVRSSEPAEVL